MIPVIKETSYAPARNCVGCNALMETWYRACTVCPDYFFCTDCFKYSVYKGNHEISHPLQIIIPMTVDDPNVELEICWDLDEADKARDYSYIEPASSDAVSSCETKCETTTEQVVQLPFEEKERRVKKYQSYYFEIINDPPYYENEEEVETSNTPWWEEIYLNCAEGTIDKEEEEEEQEDEECTTSLHKR